MLFTESIITSELPFTVHLVIAALSDFIYHVIVVGAALLLKKPYHSPYAVCRRNVWQLALTKRLFELLQSNTKPFKACPTLPFEVHEDIFPLAVLNNHLAAQLFKDIPLAFNA
jgi:hypothetical protein